MTTRLWTPAVLAALAVATAAACDKKSGDDNADKRPESASKASVEASAPAAQQVVGDALVKRVDQCWSLYEAWDKEALKGCYVDKPDVTYVDSVPPQMPIANQNDAITAAGVFRNAFPDFKGERSIVLVNGSKAAMVVLVTGTHKNPTMGMAPTRKPLSMLSAEVSEWHPSGRIARIRHYADHATMFHQLGMLESASAPAAEKSTGEQVRIAARGDDKERANLETIKALVAAIAKGDAATAATMYEPDAVFRYLPQGEPNSGRQAIEQALHRYAEVATDFEVTTRDAWAASDWVVVELTMKGKMAVSTPGAPETKGKPWELRSLEIFHLPGGKVKRHWTFANALKFAVNVGLFDPATLMGG